VKASKEWLASTDAQYSAGDGRTGWAYLRNYSAEYREWGDGPPIVLIPGLAGGFGLLGPLARQLARDFRVISYQLRGESDCFSLRHRFGLQDLVDDLAEFLDWHALERPTVLGVSFGGVLALQFAAQHRFRLNSLVLQGVSSHYVPGLLQRVAATVLSGYPLPADNPFVNQFFNLLIGSKQRPKCLFDFVTRQCWQTDQSVMAHRYGLVQQFDARSRLSAIRVPTLLLAGDRDLLVSEARLRELGSNIPRAETVRLEGCGHLAFVTHPQRVGRAVKRFLNEQLQVPV